MRVHVVDPSSYTPPYDHALCDALRSACVEVELVTSSFAYGAVPQARGYVRNELFYRHALGKPGGRIRTVSKLAEHVPDMLRYRRHARKADLVHFQWLSVQAVDGRLLPRRARGPAAAPARPPLVLTAHDILPREPRPGQLRAQRRLYERFDAIVVHSRHGRARLVDELAVDGERVHAIPHGVFTRLAERPPGAPPPPPPHETDKKVVLMLGLLRPYKGIGVLLDAWRGVDGQPPIEDAELWIAGLPKMDLTSLDAAHGCVLGLSRAGRATTPASSPSLVHDRQDARSRIRLDARFIEERELPGYFERADLVVLPYLQADQSGVLFSALAFGKPLLLSDVGGFPELAADTGAARVVPAGDARALGAALRELLGDRAALTEMCVKARAATQGHYSWKAIAAAHLRLYERLLG